MAKQFYLEAIGVEADCVEAIYNLGLANLKMGGYMEAQQAFEKLHTIVPANPEVTDFCCCNCSWSFSCRRDKMFCLRTLFFFSFSFFQVIYQIANIYEQTNDFHNALKW